MIDPPLVVAPLLTVCSDECMSRTDQCMRQMEYDRSPNAEWHAKHRLPLHPTLEQRMKWHIEHARRCPCSSHDEDILPELRKRYVGKHQDFWIDHNVNDHRALGLWVAECAEHILPYFEGQYSQDTRPRDAIRVLREWAGTGVFTMAVIRSASLAAHAAAKTVAKEDLTARYASHAAGQAVGTAHVPTHAIGAVLYAIRLVASAHPTGARAAVARERTWQNQRLPKRLRAWVDAWVDRTIPLLPRDVRMKLG